MARYTGYDISPLLAAAQQWKEKCLIKGQSVFFDERIWTSENIEYLNKYFVENLDYGEGSFFPKLQNQLAPTPASAKKLCAELMWVMLLCPSNLRPPKKRENINLILSWAAAELPENHPALTDEILGGIGSGGTAYNTLRWKELVYFILLCRSLFSLDESDRKRMLNDASAFAAWCEQIPGNESRQFRHMLLFLLFPDSNERIFGNRDRKKIASAFSGKPFKAYKNYTARQLDQELMHLRTEQEKAHATKDIDWYVSPLKEMWKTTTDNGKALSDTICPTLFRFLEQANTADLSIKHYPPTHNDLTMRVSFGAGNQAHVPWIGFLMPGQSPTKGIYPVYLYYKDDELLVLAKGVSSTNKPEEDWPGKDLVTIKEYFLERLGKEPIRYGESYIEKVYDLKEELDEDTIETDLEELISEYKELFKDVKETAEDYLSRESIVNPSEFESISDEKIMKDIFLSNKEFESILELIKNKKNVVLQGPPGVGKTFVSKRLAYALIGGKSTDQIEMIQFHQSYSYEDFIQGYRPSDAGLDLKNGIFHQFCFNARRQSKKPFVFIIDEINRGNLSKIFGELMLLIEADKRGPDWQVTLTYSKDLSEKFYVPENVYIIGLMNTADRSLSLVDYALRRRFAFFDLEPKFGSAEFNKYLKEAGASNSMINKVNSKLSALNERIAADTPNLGPGFKIGHSFFCSKPSNGTYNDDWFTRVIQHEISPLLREYWFDDPKTVKSIIDTLLA